MEHALLPLLLLIALILTIRKSNQRKMQNIKVISRFNEERIDDLNKEIVELRALINKMENTIDLYGKKENKGHKAKEEGSNP